MAKPNTFRLFFDNFETNIKTCWRTIQIEQEFCDVTFACEDKQIQAHKIIVSSSSPVLRDILRLYTNPHPLIYLRNVKFKDLENLLTFIYQGEVNVLEENVLSFLNVAQDFKIKGLFKESTGTPGVEKDMKSRELPKDKSKILHQSRNVSSQSNDENTQIPPSGERIFKFEAMEYISEDQKAQQDVDKFPEDLQDIKSFAEETKKDSTLKEIKLTQKINQRTLKGFKKKKTLEYELMEDTTKDKAGESFSVNKNAIDDGNDETDIGPSQYLPKHDNYKTKNQEVSNEQNAVNFKTENQKVSNKQNAVNNKTENKKVNNEKNTVFFNGKKIYKCKKCNIKLAGKSYLYRHNADMHKVIYYTCDRCDHKAKRKDQLRVHIEAMHEGIQYSCDQCDYKAAQKSNLKVHRQSVHEGIFYSCDSCDHVSKRKDYLKVHIETVHKGIRYSCDQCDYKTTQTGNLKRHIEVHHSEVNYGCDECDYKGRRKEYLKTHVESVHKGFLYSCDQCNYNSTWKSNLKDHMGSVHKKECFTCETCDEPFSSKSNLLKHIVSLHKDVNYQCDQCGFKDRLRENLYHHMESQHNIE